ncbi:hypothetical protein IKI14_03220 [bacterium]|nr:hypothetical protein [bacterium]
MDVLVHVFIVQVLISAQVHAIVQEFTSINVPVIHVLTLFHAWAVVQEFVIFQEFVEFVHVFNKLVQDRYLSAFSNVILSSPDER